MNLTHCHLQTEQTATCISMWFYITEGESHTFALTHNSLPLRAYISPICSSSSKTGCGQGLLCLTQTERILNAMNHEQEHFNVSVTWTMNIKAVSVIHLLQPPLGSEL